MQLRRDAAVMRLAALLGLIWLLFLLGLSLADTLSRPIMEVPGKALMTSATPGEKTDRGAPT